jgi:hypothetical protein
VLLQRRAELVGHGLCAGHLARLRFQGIEDGLLDALHQQIALLLRELLNV